MATATNPLVTICESETGTAAWPFAAVPALAGPGRAATAKRAGTICVFADTVALIVLPTTACGSLNASAATAVSGTDAVVTWSAVICEPAVMGDFATTTALVAPPPAERSANRTPPNASAASTTPRRRKTRLLGLFAWMATCAPRGCCGRQRESDVCHPQSRFGDREAAPSVPRM